MTPTTRRAYAGDADFVAVREFLIDTYGQYGWMFNWGQERWDLQRYSVTSAAELAGERSWERYTQIWETDTGIVGVVHPESGGDLWVEVDHRYRHLEDEMFAWGESHRSPSPRPERPFSTWVVVGDTTRERVLRRRNWTQGEVEAHLNRRPTMDDLPEVPVAAGYVVRSLDLSSEQDSEGRASLSRICFGTNRTGDMMQVMAQAPSYLPDLDLAAIAADGTFAAFTTVWWDATNGYIVFEPVGTHPDHRRRGLAAAVMAEGLRRGAALGAQIAYVGSGAGKASNLLYESLGFTDVTDYARWDAPARSG
ncbi:MAG: GNAT family N-acetyltransferase [Acidimicrobiia bacterium]|nr:GNAT family N-acetyltransferase [Acidimicrobiia bacterium]